MSKIAVVTFGKFAIWSGGHGLLANTIAKEAQKRRADARIYLSKAEKPLPYKMKMAWARKSVPRLSKNIIDNPNITNIFDVLVDVYDSGYTDVVIVVGGDRIKEFERLVPKYNGVPAKHGVYTFDSINVISAGDRDPDAEGVAGLSSSKLRQAAIEGDKDLFLSGVSTELSQSDKEKYYNLVRKYMGVREGFLTERSENNKPTFLSLVGGLEEPPLFFSPKMWDRVQGGLKTMEAWHVTSPEYLSKVVNIQGKVNTLSCTRKPTGMVLAGLNTNGGIMLKVRGQAVYESEFDFFSHVTKDGIKVKYRDVPYEVSKPLGVAWLSVMKWGATQLFNKLHSEDLLDEPEVAYFQGLLNNVAYVHMKKSGDLSAKFSQSLIAGPGTDPAMTVEAAWKIIYDTMKDVRKASLANLSRSDTKFIGVTMAKMIKMYLDKTEQIISKKMDSLKNLGTGRQAPWDEVLLSKIEIIEGYVLTGVVLPGGGEWIIEDSIETLKKHGIKIANDNLEVSINSKNEINFNPNDVTPLKEMNSTLCSFRDLTENTEVLSEAVFSTFNALATTPVLLLSPAVLKRVNDGLPTVKGWHVTGLKSVPGMIKIQGKRNSISVSSKLTKGQLSGVGSGNGFIFRISGQRLLDSVVDLYSQRTKDGLKFISTSNLDFSVESDLEDAWRKAARETISYLKKFPDQESITEFFGPFDVEDELDPNYSIDRQVFVMTRSRFRYLMRQEPNVISNIHPKLLPYVKKGMSLFVKTYIDEMEKVLKKTPVHSIIDLTSEFDWDEQIVSHIKIEKVYVENLYETIGKEEIELLKRARIPVEVMKRRDLENLRESYKRPSFRDILSEREMIQNIKDRLKPLTKKDLDEVEKYADRLFSKIGVDVEFTKHFLDRLNDSRNKKQITSSELIRLFRQTYKKYGKVIQNMPADAQAVIKDMVTDINVPFVINVDRKGNMDLVSKTIMRKKGFMTSNPVLAVEKYYEIGTDEYDEYMRSLTPGQRKKLKDELEERKLTDPEKTEKERVVKRLKNNKKDFKDRYGDDWKSVMYAVATNVAKDKSE